MHIHLHAYMHVHTHTYVQLSIFSVQKSVHFHCYLAHPTHYTHTHTFITYTTRMQNMYHMNTKHILQIGHPSLTRSHNTCRISSCHLSVPHPLSGETKAKMSAFKTFYLGVLAGVYIAFGMSYTQSFSHTRTHVYTLSCTHFHI